MLPAVSFDRHPCGPAARTIIDATLAAIDPRRAVTRHVQRLPGGMIRIGEVLMQLPAGRRVRIAGAGKAALAMVEGLADALGGDAIHGVVVTKGEPAVPRIGGVELLAGDHPLPSERSVEATRRVVEFLADCEADDLVLCPISGGASSLLCAPLPGISLAHLRDTVSACLRSGVPIEALNEVRSCLDSIKRGGLRAAAGPARDRVAAVVLSDVPGGKLSVVGSGPTARGAPDPRAARDALRQRGVWDGLPAPIRAALQRRGRPEVPTERRAFDVFIADNGSARRAAAEAADEAGFAAAIDAASLVGEASDVGRTIAERMVAGDPMLPPRGCLVFGGETTVTHAGTTVGGRNLELALAAVQALAAGGDDLLLVALATDGEDGTSEGAGAVVTRETLGRARAAGMDPAEHLRTHTSDHFFAALGDRINTGPTGTNVADVVFVLRP